MEKQFFLVRIFKGSKVRGSISLKLLIFFICSNSNEIFSISNNSTYIFYLLLGFLDIS